MINSEFKELKPPAIIEFKGNKIHTFLLNGFRIVNSHYHFLVSQPHKILGFLGIGRSKIILTGYEEEIVEFARRADAEGNLKKNNLKVYVYKDLEGNYYKLMDEDRKIMMREKQASDDYMNHHRDRADRANSRLSETVNEPLNEERAKKIVEDKMKFYKSFDTQQGVKR